MHASRIRGRVGRITCLCAALVACAAAGVSVAALWKAPLEPTEASTQDRIVGESIERTQQQLDRSLRFWEDTVPWSEAREFASDNYVVRTCRSRLVARRFADVLEGTRAAYAELLDVSVASAKPLAVWVFPDVIQYNQNCDASGGDEVSSRTGGWYSPGHSPPAVLSYEDVGWTNMWVIHGAVQELLARSGPGSGPSWLRNALPSYFEFQVPGHYDHGINWLSELRGLGQALRPSELVATSNDTWDEGRLRQAGMLLEYLAHHNEFTRRTDDGWPFADWIRFALRDEDTEDMAVDELLGPDLAELDEDYGTYVFPARQP